MKLQKVRKSPGDCQAGDGSLDVLGNGVRLDRLSNTEAACAVARVYRRTGLRSTNSIESKTRRAA
jgi:hypothetical protein